MVSKLPAAVGVPVALLANVNVSVPRPPVITSAPIPPVILSAKVPPVIVSLPPEPVRVLAASSDPVIFATIVEFAALTEIPPVFADPFTVNVEPVVVLFAASVVMTTWLLPVILSVLRSVPVNVVTVVAPTADDVDRLIVSSLLAVTAVVIWLPNRTTFKLLDDVSTSRVSATELAATVVARVVIAAAALEKVLSAPPPAPMPPCTVVNVLLSKNSAIS